MDFAASEAKKRGQSFPGTAVNLCRKRPGTGQPCPMRPAPAGRSGPGFVPGTPVDFAGAKKFFAPAGSNSRTKTVNIPHPVTRSRDRENAPSAGQPACGEQFAHKGCEYAHPVTRSRDRENAPSAGQPTCGEQFSPKGYGCAPPGHTQPGQRKRPSAGQPTCGEQFAHKGCGCALPGLRRRPAAQNKKGTRIGCLSVWCG